MRIRKCMLAMCFLIALPLFMCGCGKEEPTFLSAQTYENDNRDHYSEMEEEAECKNAEEKTTITVHVCGQVLNPGVYTLKAGSRWNDAIGAAGGVTADAAADRLNLAAPLEDGIRIYVPSQEEGMLSGLESGEAAENDKININLASISELCELPGIGESRAREIVAFREKNGSFQQVDDLLKVSGIKENILEKIKDYIVVR